MRGSRSSAGPAQRSTSGDVLPPEPLPLSGAVFLCPQEAPDTAANQRPQRQVLKYWQQFPAWSHVASKEITIPLPPTAVTWYLLHSLY